MCMPAILLKDSCILIFFFFFCMSCLDSVLYILVFKNRYVAHLLFSG